MTHANSGDYSRLLFIRPIPVRINPTVLPTVGGLYGVFRIGKSTGVLQGHAVHHVLKGVSLCSGSLESVVVALIKIMDYSETKQTYRYNQQGLAKILVLLSAVTMSLPVLEMGTLTSPSLLTTVGGSFLRDTL